MANQTSFLQSIHSAILSDDADHLTDICASGGDLNDQFTAQINPQHVGMTPVALASALNKPDLVRILLENGGSANATFATLNTTSLMTAAFHGHAEVVKLLLDYGADVCAIDLQQSTALGYAFGGTRNIDVIELLLHAGVDVNRKNMLGMNALLLVAGYGNDQLVEMILRAGADPNTTNEFGHNALHLSVVGKKDQLRKLKYLGSADAAAADRSLNRRNLDHAMIEWAKLHKDAVVGSQKNEEALSKVGKFMMNIGQKLDDNQLTEEMDDQEAMKQRVEAVWKYRQEKLQNAKAAKKSGVMSTLLSCGGGKAKKTPENTTIAKPYVHSEDYKPSEESEIRELNERCTRILRMLIESGCDIHCMEKTFGMTALDMAILNGDIESAALLVSYGGDEDHLMKMFASSDLYDILVQKQKKELRELLHYDRDLDINMPFSRFNITHRNANQGGLEDVSDEGSTPLTVAVRSNDMEIVKMIIKQGANINSPGFIGTYPIHEASGKGYTKMMQFLLNNKADPELPSPFFKNANALVVAVMFRKQESVRLLLKQGAKVDKPMIDGRVSLFTALEANDMEMLDLLLTADLQQNYIDHQGFMAAMAQRYQAPDRDVEAILSEATAVVRDFNEREAAMEAEEKRRQEEEQRRLEAQTQPQRQPEPVRQPAPTPVQAEPAVVSAAPAPVRAVQPGFVVVEQAAPVAAVVRTAQVPPQPGRTAPPLQKQHKDSSSDSDDGRHDESITDSGDENTPAPAVVMAPAVVAAVPGVVMQNGRHDNEEESEEEEEDEEDAPAPPPQRAAPQGAAQEQEEESEEEDEDEDEDESEIEDSDDDLPPPPPRPAMPPPVDDLDDITDSDEEEESEEEEESDEEDKNKSVETEI